MADEKVPYNLGQLDAAAQQATETEHTRSFLERAAEQLKRAGERAVKGYLEGISEGGTVGDSIFFGPAHFSQTLQGSLGVADATRVRSSDQVQPIPRQEKIPNITLNMTRIRTGLGMEVDRSLQRSQDEVVTAITQTWNVMRDRIYGLQKSVGILDKNVRVVDTRFKRFESDVSSEVDKLKIELRKLQQKKEPEKLLTTGYGPEKKADEAAAAGLDLSKIVKEIGKWVAAAKVGTAAVTATGAVGAAAGIGAGTALTGTAIAGGSLWGSYEAIRALYKKLHPEAEAKVDQSFWNILKSIWTRETPPGVKGLEELTTAGPGSYKSVSEAKKEAATGTPEKQVVEQTQVNLTAKESILVRATQSVSIQAPKITIEAAEIIFKGRVTGLPEAKAKAEAPRQIEPVAETKLPETRARAVVQTEPVAETKLPEAPTAETGRTRADGEAIGTAYFGAGPVAAGRVAGQQATGGISAAANILGATGQAGAIAGARSAGAEWTGGLKTAGDIMAAGLTGGGVAAGRVAGEAVPEAGGWGTAVAQALTGNLTGAGKTIGEWWSGPEVTQAARPLPQGAPRIGGDFGEYLKENYVPEEEEGLAPTAAILRQQEQTTLFGPGAPGIPEPAGILGLVGQGFGSLGSALSGGGAWLGARMGEWIGRGATGEWGGATGTWGPGTGGEGRGAPEAPPQLSDVDKKTWDTLVTKGAISSSDPQARALLDKLTPEQLQQIGVTKTGGPGGRSQYVFTPPTISAEEAKQRIISESGRVVGAQGSQKVSGATLDSIVSQLMAGDPKLGLKGMTKEEATIMAANFYQEGGFSMGAVGDRGTVPGGSHGLAQWNRERWNQGPNSLQAKAKEWGMDYTSHETQVKFAMWEMQQGGYQSFWKQYQAAVASGDTERAYALVRDKYEVGIHNRSAFYEGLRLLGTQKATPTRQPGEVTQQEIAEYQERYRRDYGKSIEPKLAEMAVAKEKRAVADTGPVKSNVEGSRVVQSQADVARVRKYPITQNLERQLHYAAVQTDVYAEVTSGGQERPFRTSSGKMTSSRHGHPARGVPVGSAADLKLFVIEDGKKRYLDWTNADDRQKMQKFMYHSAQAGATGIGMGEGYMGTQTMHVGGGTRAAWGGYKPYILAAMEAGEKDQIDLAEWYKGQPETQVAQAETQYSAVPKVAPGTQDVDINKPYTPAGKPEPKAETGGILSAVSPISTAQAAEVTPLPPTTEAKPLDMPMLEKAGLGTPEEAKKQWSSTNIPAMPGETKATPEVTPATEVKIQKPELIAPGVSKVTAPELPKVTPEAESFKTAEGAATVERAQTPTEPPKIEPHKVAEAKITQENRPIPGRSKSPKKEQEAPQQPGDGKNASGFIPKGRPTGQDNHSASSQKGGPGDRGKEGGGGGASPDRCHFCDP